ncbi:MAG TPA: hypothetical protein VEQ59_13370, partial [Polyangiaceae bacterium]|nr:hypothetical protein [Polyangiaceae bacterium]
MDAAPGREDDGCDQELDPRLLAFWSVAQGVDWQAKLDECAEAKGLLLTAGEERAALVGQSLVLLQRAHAGRQYWVPHFVAGLIRKLAVKGLPYSESVLLELVRCARRYPANVRKLTLAILEQQFADCELPAAVRTECEALLGHSEDAIAYAEERDARMRLQRLLAPPAERDHFVLERVDAWTDALLGVLSQATAERHGRWITLLRHANEGSGSKPGKAWQKRAQELIQALGVDDFELVMKSLLERVGMDGGFPVQVPGFFEEWAD